MLGREHIVQGLAFGLLLAVEVGDIGRGAACDPREDELR